jgi:NADPH-dependent F420 reductase
MIGFIGGTGSQGRALALRFASAGENVLLGSRSLEKAENVVRMIADGGELPGIKPCTNEEAAKKGEIIFVTLPYHSMKAVLLPLQEHLRGKTLVDVVNPDFSRTSKGVSVSEELQEMLPTCRVVCAFKNVSHSLISNPGEAVEVDSIVCSNSEDDRKKITRLSKKIGITSVDCGGLENALASELLTRILLQLNKKYKAETGIKIQFFKT